MAATPNGRRRGAPTPNSISRDENLRPPSWRSFRAVAGLLAFIITLRLPFYTSPAVHIDEQFYLVVADKWLTHGLVPFVDIWDRKPIGTFIIYAVADFLFRNAILGYQLLATAFVFGTSCIVVALGRRLESYKVGLTAAYIYPVAVALMEGAGGQTPIFYNFFVVVAVMFYVDAAYGDARSVSLGRSLLGSLFFGLAIQVKYISAIEAAILSLVLLHELHVRRGWTIRALSCLALGMMIAGLLPTIVAGASYASAGEFKAFWDTNFVSILTKRLWHLAPLEYLLRFVESSLFCVFFLPFAAIQVAAVLRPRSPVNLGWTWRLIVIWIFAALPGALGLGNPTRHYFLPTLAPLALLAAAGLYRAEQEYAGLGAGLRRVRDRCGQAIVPATILVVPIIAVFVISFTNPRERGEAADVRALADYIKAHMPIGECAFIFNRLPILYYLADVCAPSIYMFPNHLSEIGEVQTPAKERLAELQRVLNVRPPLVYVRRPYSNDLDPEALALLERALRDGYVLSYVRRGYRQFHAVYIRADKDAAN